MAGAPALCARTARRCASGVWSTKVSCVCHASGPRDSSRLLLPITPAPESPSLSPPPRRGQGQSQVRTGCSYAGAAGCGPKHHAGSVTRATGAPEHRRRGTNLCEFCAVASSVALQCSIALGPWVVRWGQIAGAARMCQRSQRWQQRRARAQWATATRFDLGLCTRTRHSSMGPNLGCLVASPVHPSLICGPHGGPVCATLIPPRENAPCAALLLHPDAGARGRGGPEVTFLVRVAAPAAAAARGPGGKQRTCRQ